MTEDQTRPGTIIGYRADGRPIHLIAGGAEIDADMGSEPEDDETDESAEDETDAQDDEWTPPSKSEFSKLQRDLKRANTQARKLKETAKSAPSEDDKEDLKTEGYGQAESKYKPLLVRAEARAQLTAMGLKGESKRFLKLLDLDEIDVDDDGDITGLEDQLAEMREDFPDLFDNRKLKGDKRTRADASDRSAGSPKVSTADGLAALIQGKTFNT